MRQLQLALQFLVVSMSCLGREEKGREDVEFDNSVKGIVDGLWKGGGWGRTYRGGSVGLGLLSGVGKRPIGVD